MPGKQVQNQGNLKDSLGKLNKIVEWFDGQSEIDVEAGLQRIREGAILVKFCKSRLAEIENEFKEIQRSVDADIPKKAMESRTEEDEDELSSDDLPF